MQRAKIEYYKSKRYSTRVLIAKKSMFITPLNSQKTSTTPQEIRKTGHRAANSDLPKTEK